MALQFPFDYKRLNRKPIDESEVFESLEAFENYLATGPAYEGQICAVKNDTEYPDLYRVNKNKTSNIYTYSPILSSNLINLTVEQLNDINTINNNSFMAFNVSNITIEGIGQNVWATGIWMVEDSNDRHTQELNVYYINSDYVQEKFIRSRININTWSAWKKTIYKNSFVVSGQTLTINL